MGPERVPVCPIVQDRKSSDVDTGDAKGKRLHGVRSVNNESVVLSSKITKSNGFNYVRKAGRRGGG